MFIRIRFLLLLLNCFSLEDFPSNKCYRHRRWFSHGEKNFACFKRFSLQTFFTNSALLTVSNKINFIFFIDGKISAHLKNESIWSIKNLMIQRKKLCLQFQYRIENRKRERMCWKCGADECTYGINSQFRAEKCFSGVFLFEQGGSGREIRFLMGFLIGSSQSLRWQTFATWKAHFHWTCHISASTHVSLSLVSLLWCDFMLGKSRFHSEHK
jgi:hypothetical protein